VGVPANKESVRSLGTPARYTQHLFDEMERTPLLFPDGRGPDVIHCWTPREIVRKFYERVYAGSKARLVIHLEDNERHMIERSFARSYRSMTRLPVAELDQMIPPLLSHPVHAERFLERADAATVIVEPLVQFLPAGKHWVELGASADEALFSPRAIDWELRQRLGVPRNATAIVYSGNVHPSNAAEVRSLYLAVALLNRERFPAMLIRTGRDYAPLIEARSNVVELGFVERSEMPSILSMADIFVQPGRPGAFNDCRFPSKIPEFCAIGRPVILPASNVGLRMRHCEDAYVLQRATAVAIADAVREIRADKALEARLTQGARRFCVEHLRWPGIAGKLREFYVGGDWCPTGIPALTGRGYIVERYGARPRLSRA